MLTKHHLGFAGVELPQVKEDTTPSLDVYTPSTDTWSTIYPAPDPEHGFPGSRSVHGLVPFTTGTRTNTFESGPAPVALLHHGERDASSLGHAGAGAFWDDAWLLLANSSPSTLQWKKLRLSGTYHDFLETRVLSTTSSHPTQATPHPNPEAGSPLRRT